MYFLQKFVAVWSASVLDKMQKLALVRQQAKFVKSSSLAKRKRRHARPSIMAETTGSA